MTDPLNHRRALVEATMRLVAANGWPALTFAALAAESGLTLGQIRHLAPMKSALLTCLNEEVDATVLRAITPDAFGGESPRERLLEVLLQRFEALTPYKPGLKRLADELRFDPALGGLLALLLPRSLAWMLEAAQIPLSGWTAPLIVTALTGLYLRALRVWLHDDSEEGGKTMAELDRLLKEAESCAKRFEPRSFR